jgi:hypothetical protein
LPRLGEHAGEVLTEAGFDPTAADWQAPTDVVAVDNKQKDDR